MNLITELLNAGIINKGKFKLKSGEITNIYIDLRKVISYPNIHKEICNKLYNKIDSSLKSSKDTKICGTPYGAISYTSYISINNNIPMIFLRKERKKHGTKKLIEGEFKVGDKVILIEDVLTTGDSVRSAAAALESEGLIVEKIIGVFSRCIHKELFYKNISIEYLYHLNDI